MTVTQAELQRIYQNLNKAFMGALEEHPDIFTAQTMTANSTTAANLYPYLGNLPGVREWVGPRVLNELATRLVSLPNKDWELSFQMKEHDIEDALGSADGGFLNAWALIAAGYGEAYRVHRNSHYTDVLVGGLTETWQVDGQYFYDSDHPLNPDNPGGSTFSNRFDTSTGDARPLSHANADYVWRKFRQIKNEQGRPMVLGAIVAEVPTALVTKAKQVWKDAVIVPGAAVGANAANMYQPNPNQDRVQTIIENPYLDANSETRWYMHCIGRVIKPYLIQERQAVRARQFNGANSEQSAMDGFYRFLTDARYAIGRTLPQLTVTADE